MTDISDLDEFDPERSAAPTRGGHSIDDLSEFEPKEESKKTEKKKEWWQGFNDDDSWSSLAARLGIGAVRGAKDVVDTGAHGIGNVASSAAEKFLPEKYSKPIRESVEASKAEDKAARDAFNTEYPSAEGILPTSTDVGRMGGQIAATAPLMPARAIQGVNALAGAAPRAAGVAAPLVNRLVGAAGAGAIGGATLGATTSSTNDQSLAENVGGGALSGAVAGPLLTGAASAGKTAGSKLIGAISPEKAALAERAEQLGINLKASQVSDNEFAKKVDQMSGFLPFSGEKAKLNRQIDQFYKAVSNTFGEDTPNITTDLTDAAKKRIGQIEMNPIKKNATLQVDQKFVQDLHGILQDADITHSPEEMASAKKLIKNVLGKVDPQTGVMPGESYHGMTKTDSILDRAQNAGSSNVRNSATRIDTALDSLFERSLPPGEMEKWLAAKARYKAASTVGEMLEKSPGDPGPLKLMRAVINSPGGKKRGGDLGELAEIAQKFLPQPKDSGTPLGNAVMSGLAHVGSLGPTAAHALYYGGGLMSAVKGGAVLGGARIARDVMNAKFVRDSLTNNALGKTNTATIRAAQKAAPYTGLPVRRDEERREPLRITVNPKE